MSEILTPENIDYYHMVKAEIPGFWERFGGKPDFTGKKVLELGSGHGSMCNEIGLAGAAQVIGLDLHQPWIDFAKAYQAEHYPDLAERVQFINMDICDYPDTDFDYIVSKATFEHVIELEKILAAIGQHLKPGGRIYTGFGPLYYSPFGDHGRTLAKLPWGYVFDNDEKIINRVNATREPDDRITSFYDLGLNKLAPDEYRRIFQESGMEIVLYKENVMMPDSSFMKRLSGHVMNMLKQIPVVDKYMTVNIWCTLEKASTIGNPVI